MILKVFLISLVTTKTYAMMYSDEMENNNYYDQSETTTTASTSNTRIFSSGPGRKMIIPPIEIALTIDTSKEASGPTTEQPMESQMPRQPMQPSMPRQPMKPRRQKPSNQRNGSRMNNWSKGRRGPTMRTMQGAPNRGEGYKMKSRRPYMDYYYTMAESGEMSQGNSNGNTKKGNCNDTNADSGGSTGVSMNSSDKGMSFSISDPNGILMRMFETGLNNTFMQPATTAPPPEQSTRAPLAMRPFTGKISTLTSSVGSALMTFFFEDRK